jgi:hypothetical protein
MASLILSGSAAAEPPKGPAWTNARVRSMSPEQVTAQLFGELSGSLYPDFNAEDLARSYGRIHTLRFYSVPRAGGAGLCETDWIHVAFAPIGKGADLNQDLPACPSEIRSMPISFIHDVERAVRGPIRTPAEQASFNEICAARDPRRESRVAAPDPEDIFIGLKLLTALTREARDGKALAPLDCSGSATKKSLRPSDAYCLLEIAAIKPGEIQHAAQPKSNDTGVTRRVEGPNWWLEFHFQPGQTLPSHEFSRRRGIVLPVRVVFERTPEPEPMIIVD